MQPLFGILGPKRPEGYQVVLRGPSNPLYVLGPYHSPCGGIDAFSGRGFGLVCELLDKYAAWGHVLFEGVIISTSMGTVGTWLAQHKSEVVVAFLETPLETCIASIKGRTGDSSRFARVAEKEKALRSVRARMIEEGLRVEAVTRDNAFFKILEWLEE